MTFVAELILGLVEAILSHFIVATLLGVACIGVSIYCFVDGNKLTGAIFFVVGVIDLFGCAIFQSKK